jgi:hypothetical protein
MRLSELLPRTVAYQPDAVPVAIDTETQELMSRTGTTLGIAIGVNLLLLFVALPLAPLMLLWLLANGTAMYLWWQLREETAAFHLGTHNHLRSMQFLSQLAEFYRVGAQVSLVVAAGAIALFVVIAIIAGLAGVVLTFAILAGMLGAGSR